MKKVMIISFTIVVIIISSIFFYIRYEDNKNPGLVGSPTSDDDYFEYIATLIPEDNNTEYSVIIPVPIDIIQLDNGNWDRVIPTGFSEFIHIQGNVTYWNCWGTVYGYGIKVTAIGPITIKRIDTEGKILYDELDMVNRSNQNYTFGDIEYLCHSTASFNISVKVNCFGRWGSCWFFDSITSEIEGTISIGWNIIPGTRSHCTA